MAVRPEFEYWRAKLDGKEPVITEDVQCGYYRGSWYKESGIIPIAVYLDGNGQQVCLVGYSPESGREPSSFFGKPETVAERWLFFCEHPIEYALYASTFASGDPWPTEAIVDAPKFDHNNPPTGLDLHKENLKALIEATRAHLKIEMKDQDKDWADKTGNYRSKIMAMRKEIDAERVEKKKPHDDASDAVQTAYKPVVDEADKWNKMCREGVAAWKAEEDRKAKEKLVAEAQKVASGEKTIEEMEVPQQVAAVGGKATGGTGRATGFTKVRRAKITNYKKALEHFQQDDRIVNIVQSLCDQQARAGEDKGPGWTVEITETAR